MQRRTGFLLNFADQIIAVLFCGLRFQLVLVEPAECTVRGTKRDMQIDQALIGRKCAHAERLPLCRDILRGDGLLRSPWHHCPPVGKWQSLISGIKTREV
ncbi:hypothetical protein SRABI106_02229 [Rahnella aquatilis]|nr:hypothetical protein SRABI106_02229 [Rahnella aquatilis]